MNQRPQKENEWSTHQNRLAEESGLAIIIVDEDSAAISESNNNSMCRILYNSEEFAPECAKFCGKAFDWATEAGKPVHYKCYAGLNCVAAPVVKKEEPLVSIVGRTFLSAEDYRAATERAISGDWQKFSPEELFENVLLTGSIHNIEKLAQRLENLSDEAKEVLWAISQKARKKNRNETENPKAVANKVRGAEFSENNQVKPNDKTASETGFSQSYRWRSLFGSLLDLSYKQACASILQFLSRRYSVKDSVWLERRENDFEVFLANGKFKNQAMEIGISAADQRLVEAARKETSLELRERQNKNENSQPQSVHLFPIAVGAEIQSALVIGDLPGGESGKRHIARFCRSIAPQLEILRLREEVMRHGWLSDAVRKFNESIKDIDGENFWSGLAQISAELMKAERSSLLIFDEKSNRLVAKAATGSRADIIKNESGNVGERIAVNVFVSGKPIVVSGADKIPAAPAPPERNYKSNSFISYPIKIGERKIGVLNVTDRADGKDYGESDLILLNAIMPQLAVLIDRVRLKHQAGEFEQLSVTDALTGLLNRRYLEVRLGEEIKRSNRYGFPVSFMMIDVDEFKAYNDRFSHPEGDRALQIVGQCLKETLRGADVAARYGGEEFSILLPQTTTDEAETIAERVREKIESTPFPKRRITVSIGIASCSKVVCTPQNIIAAADYALYEAKRRGRNNVQVYENLKVNLFVEARRTKRDK